MDDWRKRAKCAQPGANPRDWDVESLPGQGLNVPPGRREAIAKARCAGCLTWKECGADAVRPMYSIDGARLHTTGVIRCGLIT